MVLLLVIGSALLVTIVDCATLGRKSKNYDFQHGDGKCEPDESVCHFSYMNGYSHFLLEHNTYIPKDWHKCNETENCRKRWTPAPVYKRYGLCRVWDRCEQHQGLQSPIDVETDEARYVNFNPMYINARDVWGNFTNNGHSPTFTVEKEGVRNHLDIVMRGVPGRRNTDYVFYELHFHIGARQNKGSEHSINERFYDGELHMVHWKRDRRTRSPSQAAEAKDGLMAIAVFFEVDPASRGNTYMDYLIRAYVSQIKELYRCVNATVNPAHVLPRGGCIYSYAGSKTTPPCMETLRFLLYSKPAKISQHSYDILAEVQTSDGPSGHALLSDYGNRRPIQERDVEDLIHNCCNRGRNCEMEEREIEETA